MKVMQLLSLLIVLLATTISRGEEQPKLPVKERFHLYLLIGQSNMAGRGTVEEQDKVPHPRVLTFTKEQTWAPALDPLHFDKPQIAGVGLGSSFGRSMAEANPEITIGLVPCAVGGTPLERWQRGGDLYQQAVARSKVALRDGTLRGILWHQGEADSARETTARNYGERLAKMVTDLRGDLESGDVPFVAGKLGEFLARQTKDGNPSFWPVVNEQIAALPNHVKNTAFVSSAELKHKGDGVHFDSTSLRLFGKRYAEAMLQLQRK